MRVDARSHPILPARKRVSLSFVFWCLAVMTILYIRPRHDDVFHVEHSPSPQPSATPGIHPALQDEHRCHLIHDLHAAFDRHVSLAQQAVGLGRTEALVPEMNR